MTKKKTILYLLFIFTLFYFLWLFRGNINKQLVSETSKMSQQKVELSKPTGKIIIDPAKAFENENKGMWNF